MFLENARIPNQFNKGGNSMYKLSIIFQTAFALFIAFTVSLEAGNVIKTATVGPMRIELNILLAEPFFTADEVRTKKVHEGMLIISGAEPLSLEASTHPNRHLVVHIFDVKTGKAMTTAKVRINFQRLDAKGKPIGDSVNVPIVVMQAIGKGLESTHYGNNVLMPAGSYSITVVANGKKVGFKVMLSEDVTTPSDKMHMK
jgi:hypothetical protein